MVTESSEAFLENHLSVWYYISVFHRPSWGIDTMSNKVKQSHNTPMEVPGIEPWSPGLPVRSQTLYWLSYPGSQMSNMAVSNIHTFDWRLVSLSETRPRWEKDTGFWKPIVQIYTQILYSIVSYQSLSLKYWNVIPYWQLVTWEDFLKFIQFIQKPRSECEKMSILLKKKVIINYG
jgi:hypothetical protein